MTKEVENLSEAQIKECVETALDRILARPKTRIWVAVKDDRTCSACASLHGFQLDYHHVHPPLHKNCRCHTVTRRKIYARKK